MSKKKWYRIYIEWRKARKSGLDLRAFYMVRPAGARSNRCKSGIRPVVGRI